MGAAGQGHEFSLDDLQTSVSVRLFAWAFSVPRTDAQRPAWGPRAVCVLHRERSGGWGASGLLGMLLPPHPTPRGPQLLSLPVRASAGLGPLWFTVSGSTASYRPQGGCGGAGGPGAATPYLTGH